MTSTENSKPIGITEEYQYSPLPTPTSIRLFRVEKKDNANNFHCSMKVVDLRDNPWYHAFSYTWGNPHAEARDGHAFTTHFQALDPEYSVEAKKQIFCDGKILHINRNLYDALGDVPKDAWSRYINRKDTKRGWTRLHVYVVSEAIDMVQQTLSSNVDLDATDNIGATALNWAARIGNFDILELLVEAGANIDVTDNDGQTALDRARQLNVSNMVEYLEKARFKPEAQSATRISAEGPEGWAWIDQICINQEDLNERCSQVGIMHDVYSKSQFTLIWLGREDQWTRSAIFALCKLSYAGETFLASDIEPYVKADEEIYYTAGIPYISEQEWLSLAALFQRQYFRRLWVVQENILSNQIIAYCGSVEILWKDMCAVAELLHIKQLKAGLTVSSIYVPLNEATRGIEQPIVQLANWKQRWQSPGHETNPRRVCQENLIVDTWTFRATDPRDKIYGTYGLLNLASSKPLDWAVDYSKSVEQVFAEAVKRVFSEAGELRMLSSVVDHSMRKIPTLPSWVPDYSLPFTNMIAACFNAAGKLRIPSPIWTSESWETLKVRGVQIDTISRFGSTTSGALDPRQFFDPSWLEMALLIPSSYHHTSQCRTEVLWRTLCANQATDGSIPAPAQYSEDFRDMISQMIVRAAWLEEHEALQHPELQLSPSLKDAVDKLRKLWSEPPLSEESIENIEFAYSDPTQNFSSPEFQVLGYTLLKLHVLSMTESHQGNTPTLKYLLETEARMKQEDPKNGGKHADPWIKLVEMTHYSSEFVSAFRGRVGRKRLFVTEGRYLGLGPASMREGDGVWVLPGAGAAFILRKVDVTDDEDVRCNFIGEAYVHGIMNGEAVDGKDVQMRDISLT